MLKNILSLLCNAVIVWRTAASVAYYMRHDDDGARHACSGRTFRYFTTDSNVLCGIGALAVLPFNLAALSSGALSMPAWALALKYSGASAVTLTLLTVLLFLGPTQGYRAMFSGHGLYLHLIGPLLAAFSFCFLETGTALSPSLALWAALPMFAYAMVYLVMVVVIGPKRGGWEDFYGFNSGGKWPVSLLVMLIAGYVVCLGLGLVHNAL